MTKPVAKTIEMTKAQFNKWHKGLVSGKYEQTTEALCTIDHATGNKSYCCLGVLEDVLEGKVEAHLGVPSDQFLKRHDIKFYDLLGRMTVGNSGDENDPFMGNGNTAASLNDNGATFKQIAQRLKNRVKFIPAKKAK